MSDLKRIGKLGHLEVLKHQIELRRASIARLQLMAATGKRVLAPSDDPPAASRAVVLKLQLASTDQLLNSLQEARNWVSASQGGLDTLMRVLSEARVITLQGANDTQSADSRAVLAQRINSLLEEVASASQLALGGDHVFAGESFDQTPYLFTRDPEGRITGVTAQAGIDGDVERLVDRDVRLTVNVSPSAVFGVDDPAKIDVFQALIEVRDALYANDAAALPALTGDLRAAEDQVLAENTALGAVLQRVEDLHSRIDLRQLSLETSLSETEDADVAATLIDLQNQETVLETALQTTARVMQLSLFDYI